MRELDVTIDPFTMAAVYLTGLACTYVTFRLIYRKEWTRKLRAWAIILSLFSFLGMAAVLTLEGGNFLRRELTDDRPAKW